MKAKTCWKTTVCGILSLAGTLITQTWFDDVHIAKIGIFLAGLGSGLGLIFARDFNKSDEDVGIDPQSRETELLKKQDANQGKLLGVLFACFLVMTIMAGCASFRSFQKETRVDGTTVEQRQSVVTFWDAQSQVAKLRASTTDKSQGLTVGSLSEQSEATNAVAVIQAVTEAAVKAAIKP